MSILGSMKMISEYHFKASYLVPSHIAILMKPVTHLGNASLTFCFRNNRQNEHYNLFPSNLHHVLVSWIKHLHWGDTVLWPEWQCISIFSTGNISMDENTELPVLSFDYNLLALNILGDSRLGQKTWGKYPWKCTQRSGHSNSMSPLPLINENG